MTYGEILSFGKEYLESSHITDFESDAWLLFSYCVNMNRTKYIMKMKDDAPDCISQAYEVLLSKRSKGVPVQYLLGTQSFYGYDFFVNENVLIPRADTEVLVNEALKLAGENAKVLDLCTGSGCIAVSVKLERSDITVSASDISKDALKIARLNADYNNADITFYESDLFGSINEKYDVIISNPPYIETEEIEKLESNVKDFEPRTALDGGITGLDFYERIFSEAGDYLSEHGVVAVEIGYNQAAAVSDIAGKNGFENIRVVKDLSGLDRVVTAVLK